MVNKDFIILGCGISGLTLANELVKKGCKVTLYEKNSYVGGLASTNYFKEFPIDTGPHIFHSAHKEIVAYWRDLVGESLKEKNFYSGNFQNGKIYDYPINKETMCDQYDENEIEIIKNELNKNNLKNLSESKNYFDYVKVLAGDYLSNKFFKKYPEKLWGLNTKNLSARFAPRRIEIREKRKPFHSGPGRFAGIIEGGCGLLAKKLSENISNLGGIINLNNEIVSFEFSDDSNQNINKLFLSSGDCIETKDSILISSLPITKNANLFNIETDLYFRSILLVNIIVKGKDPFPKNYDWLYFDSNKCPFHRAGIQTRFSKENVLEGHEIICCEIVYEGNLKNKNITKFKNESINNLESFGLLKNVEIIDVFINDVGPVYPGYYFGHEKELANINAHLGFCNNFYSLGSLADYAYSDLQVITAKSIDLASELATIDKSFNSDIIKDKDIIKPSSEFNFGNKIISKDLNINSFLIAEIGLAHNGSVEICKKLIQASVDAGFNAVKIQTYSKGRVSKKTRTSRYFEESLGQEEPIAEFLDNIIFDDDQLKEIFDFANSMNIEMFSTPFDKNSVDFLNSLNVRGFKISSMDLVNIPLIRYTASFKKPIILSTGMSSLGEIEVAVEACLEEGNDRIAVLHCISSYPCPIEFTNLNRIKTISDTFGVISGFSDHTIETITPSLAIASGARIVEKHITLDKGMDGPDHNFSLIPNEMIEMVTLVRKVEKSLSNHQLKKSPAELLSKQNLRRSIYAAIDLNPGDIITEDCIAIKSPGDGLPVKYLDIILNKRINGNIKKDYPINWDLFFNK